MFGSSAIIDQFGNKDLDWQRTLDKNIGVDIIHVAESNPGDAGLLLQGYRSSFDQCSDASVRGRGFH